MEGKSRGRTQLELLETMTDNLLGILEGKYVDEDFKDYFRTYQKYMGSRCVDPKCGKQHTCLTCRINIWLGRT